MTQKIIRWVVRWLAIHVNLVVVDHDDYEDAQATSESLWQWTMASGYLPNTYHARQRVLSASRRIATRLGVTVAPHSRTYHKQRHNKS